MLNSITEGEEDILDDVDIDVEADINDIRKEGELSIIRKEEKTNMVPSAPDMRETQKSLIAKMISIQDMKKIVSNTDLMKYHGHLTEIIPDLLGDLFNENNDQITGEQIQYYNAHQADNDTHPISVIKEIIKKRYARTYAVLLKSVIIDTLEELINHGYASDPNYKVRFPALMND